MRKRKRKMLHCTLELSQWLVLLMQTLKKREMGEKKNGETRQKWAIITSKRPLGLALQALLKQLKGNKTRRPAKELCLKQHIKSNTSLCAHWFRHSPCTRAGRPPAKPLWILIEKMACASYYGSMFSISLRLLCHYLLKSPPSVYVDSERGTCTLNWDVLRSEGGSKYLFILDCACSSLLGRNKKNIPSSDVLKIQSAS